MSYIARPGPLLYETSTAATAEPVDVATVRRHLRETRTENDERIARNAKSARAEVERRTHRQLMPATLKLYLRSFPDEIRLPRSPLQSVTSITYLDANGTSQTLSTSVYTVDTISAPGRIYLAYGQTWPATYGTEKSVTVTFVAGYSSSATTATARAAIPSELIDAILVGTELLYDSPDDKMRATLEDRFSSLIASEYVPNTPEAVQLA